MDYRRYHDAWAVRLDPGEEIAACLADISRREDIRTAAVVGLGAANEVEAGLFDTRTKGYRANVWRGDMEITSLTGSITRREGEPYLHLHITVCDETGAVRGGHLSRAVVSATAEIFLLPVAGEIGRRFDEGIGLNLFQF